MKKICSSCKDEKDIELFNFRNKAKGIKHSYCADCGKLKTQKHYQNNKESYVKKARKHRTNNTEFLRKQKDKPCMDCGIKYPYYVMDFDHLKDKKFGLSQQGKHKGINVLKTEVAKCEVVCANCHRERTHKRNTLG